MPCIPAPCPENTQNYLGQQVSTPEYQGHSAVDYPKCKCILGSRVQRPSAQCTRPLTPAYAHTNTTFCTQSLVFLPQATQPSSKASKETQSDLFCISIPWSEHLHTLMQTCAHFAPLSSFSFPLLVPSTKTPKEHIIRHPRHTTNRKHINIRKQVKNSIAIPIKIHA